MESLSQGVCRVRESRSRGVGESGSQGVRESGSQGVGESGSQGEWGESTESGEWTKSRVVAEVLAWLVPSRGHDSEEVRGFADLLESPGRN